jgi:sulfate permease, SulP family
VSQSVPNPEGNRANASRDFVAMGVANAACGFVRALPVGGSLSATALSLLAGAGSRWAAILAGVWMGIVVVAFPQLMSPIVMPALGALLVVAGARTLQPGEVVSIWRTGWPSRLTIVATFLAMLSLPIQAAIAIGVVLSALLYITAAGTDVVLVEQRERPGGAIEERRPRRELASDAVTVLHVYGHIFYAGARTLERQLPAARGARNPVVVLRLRGRTNVGATLIEVLTRYAGSLREANGRLYLTGLSRQLRDDIVRTGKLDLAGPVRAYEATSVLGQSTREAVADAQDWLVRVKKGGDSTPLATE